MDQNVTRSLLRGNRDERIYCTLPRSIFRPGRVVVVASSKQGIYAPGRGLPAFPLGSRGRFEGAEEFTNNGYVTTGS